MSIWQSVKRTLGAAALGIAIFTAAPANAALTIDGGTGGDIPGGETNDGLMPLLGVNSLTGFYGAEIKSDGSGGGLKYEFLGYEAAFNNWFQVGGVTVFSNSDQPGGNEWATLAAPFATYIGADVNGTIDFRFVIDADLGTLVVNGFNPDDAGGEAGPNFFAYQLPDGSILLWLDDEGASNDDNHDDMVIRISQISQVPEPGTLGLLALGLLGLGTAAIRRRRTA